MIIFFILLISYFESSYKHLISASAKGSRLHPEYNREIGIRKTVEGEEKRNTYSIGIDETSSVTLASGS
jgi:hypothetical protein